jgi:hypothetical protein
MTFIGQIILRNPSPVQGRFLMTLSKVDGNNDIVMAKEKSEESAIPERIRLDKVKWLDFVVLHVLDLWQNTPGC